MKKTILITVMILIIFTVALSDEFYPDIRPGYGVTDIGWLSDYFSPLKGTNMDTPVFYMESGVEGPTFLLLGGTHPREIAGTTAATLFLENVVVESGRVIVIPFANKSAASVADSAYRPEMPHFIPVETKSGIRYLVYADRRTDIIDQGIEDPETFIHYPTGFKLEDGSETRNLNRCYPGKIDGTPTQQLAYGIMELIRNEKVNFNLDMHESDTPEEYTTEDGNTYQGGRLAYMLVCHPKGIEIGAMVNMSLEDEGFPMKLEESSFKFRGLSHREIGDNSDCISFLSESPNPAQDRWRKNPDVIDDEKYPLNHRVGMHLDLIRYLIEYYNMFSVNGEILIENIPYSSDLTENGIEYYLN